MAGVEQVVYELRLVRERRQGYGSLRQVRSPQDIFDAFRVRFATRDREEFLAVILDYPFSGTVSVSTGPYHQGVLDSLAPEVGRFERSPAG